MRKRITILSPTLSGNAFSRVYILVKLLEPDFDVDILAFSQFDEVWRPVREDRTLRWRRFGGRSLVSFLMQQRRAVRHMIAGDVIVAVKPFLQSFGVGLYARRVLRRPLLLDIDDFELGFISESLYWEFRHHKLGWITRTESPFYTRLMDGVIHRADAITVSNRFLQQRYGGVWIPHARDPEEIERMVGAAPSLADGLDGRKSVVFLGSVRDHKGLDDLLAAWTLLNRSDAILRIIGTPLDLPIVQALRASAGQNVRFEGLVPYEQTYSILATADLVVIPQKGSRAGHGQLPIKLIDAMAARRAIIGTSVGDISWWLDGGAGVVVPPEDPQTLAAAIGRVLDDAEYGSRLGERAHHRFLENASFDVVRPRFIEVIHSLLQKQRSDR